MRQMILQKKSCYFLNSWHRVEIALIIVLDSLLAQTLKKLKKTRGFGEMVRLG